MAGDDGGRVVKLEKLLSDETNLPPGLTADAGWFHTMRTLFEGGQVGDMGPVAFTVLSAIKSFTGMRDGTAFPGQDTLAKQLQVSQPTVKRAISVLVSKGYLQVTKRGRANVYTLIEHVPLRDSNGQKVATVSAPYVPVQFGALLEEIKRAAAAGGPVSFNITLVTGGGDVTVHNHAPADLHMLPNA